MSLFTGMSDTAVGERGDLREEGDGEAGHVVSSGHDGDDTGGGRTVSSAGADGRRIPNTGESSCPVS